MPRRRPLTVAEFERLEARDCPAVVSIAGPQTIQENGAPITLTASLSAPQTKPVEVRYLTYGSATLIADYRLTANGLPLLQSGTITFKPGQTSIPIVVTPINDTLREGNESFNFQLISVQGHSLGNSRASATIIDDDNYTAQLIGPSQIAPGERGAYTLQLSSPATKPETFYVSTRDGTATSKGNDYSPLINFAITIMPGQTSQSFSIAMKPNSPTEYDEFFYLTARPRTADFPAVTDLGVVIPGIGPEPPPTISIGNASGNEGDTGTQTLVFDVSLSKAYSQIVTVDYATADGTATVADTDYTAVSGRLSFLPGETRKTVSVSVIGDTKPELTETFTLVLSAPTNATIANGTGVGTIVNDDGQDGFQITVNYIGNVGDRVRTAVTQAVAKWQQVITGDVPSYVNPFNGQLVDDIVLDVRMGLLGPAFPTGTDGATGSNTIANAGPLYGGAPGVNGQLAIRPSPRLPYWGTIGFDPANAATDSAQSLYTTALHEIGHALGFGTPLLVEARAGYPNGLVVPLAGNQANPVYIGTAALQAYNQIFQRNAVNIPMESEGGDGTALVHWDDAAVPSELMNGFLTIGAPLSRITVGAMQDLGYQVNMNAADNYSPRVAALATGTSVSAPAWSGILAVVDGYRLAAGRDSLANAQVAMYSMPSTDFNDITVGDNRYRGSLPYSGQWYAAKPGYDLVTGLGTPKADKLIPDLVAYTGSTSVNLASAAGPSAQPAAVGGVLASYAAAFQSEDLRADTPLSFDGRGAYALAFAGMATESDSANGRPIRARVSKPADVRPHG